MPARLYFTDSDEANELIAKDPMALLIGFALDQQVTVPKAFSGPLAIKERVGTLDPKKLAKADLDPVFREKPAIHRFPGKNGRTRARRPRRAGARRLRRRRERGSGRTRRTAPSCGRTSKACPASAR